MPSDNNLTAALRASLVLEGEGFSSNGSPLSEASSGDAVKILLDRINEAMAEGLPEKITDQTLMQLIDVYRAQALRWEQEEQREKKPRNTGPKKSHKEALLDFDISL